MDRLSTAIDFPTLILVPHAESAPLRLGSSLRAAMNLKLTPEGELATVQLATSLKSVLLDAKRSRASSRVRVRIATSPLQRCRETARLFAHGLGSPEENVDLSGLLGGLGLINLNMQIRFVQEGPVRTVNRILNGDGAISNSKTIRDLTQELLRYSASRLDETLLLKSAKATETVWLCVSQPTVVALFIADVFHLIEFNESTWPEPIEPVVVQRLDDDDGQLRVHWRTKSRDVAYCDWAANGPSSSCRVLPCCGL